MKNKNIIPLDITNKISEKYPNVWEQVEQIRNSRNSVLEKWDDHCYIPIAYAIAIASQGKEVTSDAVLDGAIIAAVAPWRLYKQIYEFDPDMENVLLSQDKEDLVIPIEILKTLPYQSIYIKTSYDDYDGFFVYFESDYNTKEFEKNIYISLETHKKKYNILVKKYKQTFTMNIKKSKLIVLTHKSYKKRNDTKHQK